MVKNFSHGRRQLNEKVETFFSDPVKTYPEVEPREKTRQLEK